MSIQKKTLALKYRIVQLLAKSVTLVFCFPSCMYPRPDSVTVRVFKVLNFSPSRKHYTRVFNKTSSAVFPEVDAVRLLVFRLSDLFISIELNTWPGECRLLAMQAGTLSTFSLQCCHSHQKSTHLPPALSVVETD